MQKPKKKTAPSKAGRPERKADRQSKPESGKSSEIGPGERINRYLATCGLCSRREADRWIAEGRIALNGKTVEQPGVKIGRGDIVAVDGRVVTPALENTYILYNKPRGLLCSRKDAKGRPLIYEHLDIAANVQSVGRLDMDSEGLLILTDNGALAQKLTHPGAKIPRQYRVRITGQLSLESLESLRRGGIDIGDGELSDPWEITVDSGARGHSWFTVTIHRGRWREIRRTVQACGHEVRRLLRTRFGPLKLDPEMPPGAWRNLTAGELRQLKKAAAFGQKG
ncbi:MAG: pseudouridine synthase [Mariprofundaceae bacterium]|nr:pseudouridine synthase [Mariprofundaceae bacterium]